MRFEEFKQPLNENLGNLAQLNANHLIGMLKQSISMSRRTREPHTSPVASKFQHGGPAHGPGATSEIIDAGVVKKGLADIRKAYKTHRSDGITAFVLYLNGRAVAMGRFSEHDLGGSSRLGMFAYDLTPFEEQMRQAKAAEEEEKGTPTYLRRSTTMPATTAYSKTRQKWGIETDEIHHYVGQATAVSDLNRFVTVLMGIANLIGGTVTLKLVTHDAPGVKKSQDRWMLKQSLYSLGEDLRTRLARYKNSKRPTAETIQEFLDYVMNSSVAAVRFAGKAYRIRSTNSGRSATVDPMALLRGKEFIAEFGSIEPGDYRSLKVSMVFDRESNQIKPIKAEYHDAVTNTQEVAVIDKEAWTKATLGVKSLDKPEVIKSMLTRIKDRPDASTFKEVTRVITELRSVGIDWPEFDIILRGIEEKKREQQ